MHMNMPTKSSQSSLDVADHFTLQVTRMPAMPSQHESLRGALRMLASIAVRMGQSACPLPPRDLTCAPTEAMNAGPSRAEGRN